MSAISFTRALIDTDANLLDTWLKNGKRNFGIDNRIKGEMPALHFATIFRRADVIKVLLDHGANVDLRDEDGCTCLHLAAEDVDSSNNLLRAREILKDVALNDELKEKLASAFSMETENQERVREMLFESDDRLQMFRPCVKYASLTDNCSLVELLLRSRADPNVRTLHFGLTPLLEYCYGYKNDARIIDLLLDYGADVTITNNYGRSALDSAVQDGSVKIVEKLLLDRAAGTAIVGPSALQKLLNGAAFSIYGDESTDDEDNNDILIAGLLIEQGAQVNGFDVDTGPTPLQTAVLYGSLKAVKYLSSLGADPNLLRSNENSWGPPLALAVTKNRHEVAECLIDAGADVSYKNPEDQSSLLRNAVRDEDPAELDAEENWKCVTMLMKRGVTVGENDFQDLNEEEVELLQTCQKEFEALKKIKICPESPVTYYDFLLKRDKALVCCFRNQNIASAIESRDYALRFHYFSESIEAKCESGLQQLKMMDELASILSDTFKDVFPEEIILMICDYFDLEGLRKCFGFVELLD